MISELVDWLSIACLAMSVVFLFVCAFTMSIIPALIATLFSIAANIIVFTYRSDP